MLPQHPLCIFLPHVAHFCVIVVIEASAITKRVLHQDFLRKGCYMTEVEIFKQSLDISRIVMLLTILMTVISATFSALTLAFQRSHNKKSVKPLCDVCCLFDSNRIRISVKNAGLGPMIVNKISILEQNDNEISLSAFCDNLKEDTSVTVSSKVLIPVIVSVCEEKLVLDISKSVNDSSGCFGNFIQDQKKLLFKAYFSDIYDKQYSFIKPFGE